MTAQKDGDFQGGMRKTYAFEEECRFWKQKKIQRKKKRKQNDKWKFMMLGLKHLTFLPCEEGIYPMHQVCIE